MSGIQSGNFSGPVGGTIGQQPYRDGLFVREQQQTFWGWTPEPGYIEIRARGIVTQRSMVGFWLAGIEDQPQRSAEICIGEMFGDALVAGESTEVGMGLRALRDPSGTEDFQAVRLPIDVTDFHTYAVDWTVEKADFFVDGEHVRTCHGPRCTRCNSCSPSSTSEKSNGADEEEIPSLIVDSLRGYQR